MISENKSAIQAVVSDDLKAWLKARAEAEGRSLSNFVAVLLEKARVSESGRGKEKSIK